MLAVCLGSLLPNTMAATKYNYIANGEKDILGFKISGIVQKEECDTIEIILNANKNVVEFSTYQDVIYNGTTYKSGNHTIEKTNNVAFIYEVKDGETLSPIIIYLETIENTSCPLEIRYCKDDTIVEKVNMTLVATFYADQASDLRENKENSSGSLVQEDVIISRPNIPSKPPVEPSEPDTPPATDPVTPPTADPVTPPVEECKHTETKVVGAKESTIDEEGYTGDTVCVKCDKVITKGNKIDKLPSVPSEEIELPIIDESTIPSEDDETTTPPVITQPTKPDDKPIKPEQEENNFFSFINSIPKTYIYVAIGGVGLLLVIVIILIIALGSKKKKEPVQVEQVPVSVPPMPPMENPEFMQEEIPAPIPVQEETMPITPVIPVNNELEIDDKLLNFETETPAEGIQDNTSDEVIEVDNNVETTEETFPVTPVVFDEPVVEEIPAVDEYSEIIMATLPATEIEKIKQDFEDIPEGSFNEYDNIIQ